MQWQLLDAIGPFFRGIGQRRVNWSKIPFEQWDRIAADLGCLANEARRLGFNALTLDDVAHLAPHPWHGDELNARLVVFREEITALIRMVHRLGLAVFLTTDALPLSAGVRILNDGATVEQVVAEVTGPGRAVPALELLRHAETAVRELYYIEEFARLKLFFRRVRIPPLLHVYWDCLFINPAVRRILVHFVKDPETAVRGGEAALGLFPHMLGFRDSRCR